jgi:hypothetical protein
MLSLNQTEPRSRKKTDNGTEPFAVKIKLTPEWF